MELTVFRCDNAETAAEYSCPSGRPTRAANFIAVGLTRIKTADDRVHHGVLHFCAWDCFSRWVLARKAAGD